MEEKFCQSCGMPLTDEITGTCANGSASEDYCIYSYKDGNITVDLRMGQMIEYYAGLTDEINKCSALSMTIEEARKMMHRLFPPAQALARQSYGSPDGVSRRCL